MESIKYYNNFKNAVFNGRNYVRDDETGYYLCHDRKIGTRLHRDVYEFFFGKIPNGAHIHHIDHDKRNNNPENLEALDGAVHLKKHGKEQTKEERERKRKNMIENVSPKAAEWHSSDEGIMFHKKIGKESWEKRKEFVYTCAVCGKEFTSKKTYNKKINVFCSNSCKSKNRVLLKKDYIERSCVICGNSFNVNKYSKTRTCGRKCGYKIRFLEMA